MTTLVERAEELLGRVERYERRRRHSDDVLAVRQAHEEFQEHLESLNDALAQVERLRSRGERTSLPDGSAASGLIDALLNSISAGPDGVRERAEAERAVRQHVRAVEIEVEAATRAYVDRARKGLDLRLVTTLRQVGLADDAARLRPALLTLAQASQQLPRDDAGFVRVDEAAAEIDAVTAALEAPKQALLLSFLRTLIAAGGEISLDELDADVLGELKRTGAAKNFVVRGGAES